MYSCMKSDSNGTNHINDTVFTGRKRRTRLNLSGKNRMVLFFKCSQVIRMSLPAKVAGTDFLTQALVRVLP